MKNRGTANRRRKDKLDILDLIEDFIICTPTIVVVLLALLPIDQFLLSYLFFAFLTNSSFLWSGGFRKVSFINLAWWTFTWPVFWTLFFVEMGRVFRQ